VYSYKAFFEEGVLITRFYNEYIQEEGDKSLLAICRSMTIDQRLSIKTVIWDLKDVTAMSVVNTDIARVTHFERELLKMFKPHRESAAQHVKRIQVFHIPPSDKAVANIFRERLERVAHDSRKTPRIESDEPRGLPELLESLNLLKLLPLLDGEWQK